MKTMKVAPSVIRAFRRDLASWFARHRRSLPWRTRRTPYRVWISELMLQQTRVEQVIPYFRRFMKRFPSVVSLAEAPRQDVLKLWEGLGYYARARRAQDTARYLVREAGGRFPETAEGLLALPGIGPYTAAAVGSLALGLDMAVVDGNVIRVLSRVMAYRGDARSPAARRQFQRWAEDLIVPGRAGESNEAVMELGALCCTPRNPQCPICPLRRVCKAHALGRATAFPVQAPRGKVPHKVVGAGVVIGRGRRVLIAQRKESSMLGGLWEFPGGTREPGETMPQCIARELKEEMGISVMVGPHLVTVPHAYSHFTIELHTYWAKIRSGRPKTIHCADFAWVKPAELRKYPFSRADLEIVQCLEKWSGDFPSIGKN
ncbi:MAG TPA: A/G-specific adenine glycosylase [Kiritimatiellia bacterium]|nr:A/G-specific adenine glycosylase [Kiritimatiellia bacterium]